MIHKGTKDKDLLGLIGEDIEKIHHFVATIPFEKLFTIFDEIYQLRSKSYFLRIKNTYEARILIEVTLLKIQDKLNKPTLDEIIHDINQISKLFEGQDISEEKLFKKENNNKIVKKDFSLEDEIQSKFLGTYITDENKIPKLPNF